MGLNKIKLLLAVLGDSGAHDGGLGEDAGAMVEVAVRIGVNGRKWVGKSRERRNDKLLWLGNHNCNEGSTGLSVISKPTLLQRWSQAVAH